MLLAPRPLYGHRGQRLRRLSPLRLGVLWHGLYKPLVMPPKRPAAQKGGAKKDAAPRGAFRTERVQSGGARAPGHAIDGGLGARIGPSGPEGAMLTTGAPTVLNPVPRAYGGPTVPPQRLMVDGLFINHP